MMINKEHEMFQFTQLNNNINRLSAKTKNSVLNIVPCRILKPVTQYLFLSSRNVSKTFILHVFLRNSSKTWPVGQVCKMVHCNTSYFHMIITIILCKYSLTLTNLI
jgi:hypothetical protein